MGVRYVRYVCWDCPSRVPAFAPQPLPSNHLSLARILRTHRISALAFYLSSLARERPLRAYAQDPLDHGSFCASCRMVWLATSSRADFATRGLSISFLTRASVAWLDSCIGSFFF